MRSALTSKGLRRGDQNWRKIRFPGVFFRFSAPRPRAERGRGFDGSCGFDGSAPCGAQQLCTNPAMVFVNTLGRFPAHEAERGCSQGLHAQARGVLRARGAIRVIRRIRKIRFPGLVFLISAPRPRAKQGRGFDGSCGFDGSAPCGAQRLCTEHSNVLL